MEAEDEGVGEGGGGAGVDDPLGEGGEVEPGADVEPVVELEDGFVGLAMGGELAKSAAAKALEF